MFQPDIHRKIREKERKEVARYRKEIGVGRQRDSGLFVGRRRIRKKQQVERLTAYKQKRSHITYGSPFIHPR
jgi:hypothetical protein